MKLIKDEKYGVYFTEQGNEFDSVTFYGIVEQDEYGLGKMKNEGLQPKIVFDVGGHIGSFSYKVKMLWPDAKIVMIEPNSRSMDIAKKNLKGFDDIIFIKEGLWYGEEKPEYFMQNNWCTIGSCFNGFWLEESYQNQKNTNYFYLEKDYDVNFCTLEDLMDTCLSVLEQNKLDLNLYTIMVFRLHSSINLLFFLQHFRILI